MAFSGYVALGTSTGPSNFTETTATGYARNFMAFGNNVGNIIQGYGLPVNFTNTGLVTSINAYAFYQNSTGGSPILVYQLGQTVPFGSTFTVNPYSITLDMMNGLAGTGQQLDLSGASILGGSNGAFMLNKRAFITSDQILTLQANPIEIVPAPAPNQIISLIALSMVYNYGTTPYIVPNGYLYFTYGIDQPQDPNYIFSNTAPGFLTQTSSCFNSLRTSLNGKVLSTLQGLSIFLTAYDPVTAGDGTLAISFWYTLYNM